MITAITSAPLSNLGGFNLGGINATGQVRQEPLSHPGVSS